MQAERKVSSDLPCEKKTEENPINSRPIDYAVCAVLMTVILPCVGVPALVYVVRSRRHTDRGDMKRAWRESRHALVCITAGLVIIALLQLLWFCLLLVEIQNPPQGRRFPSLANEMESDSHLKENHIESETETVSYFVTVNEVPESYLNLKGRKGQEMDHNSFENETENESYFESETEGNLENETETGQQSANENANSTTFRK